jgi:hypothetical protein
MLCVLLDAGKYLGCSIASLRGWFGGGKRGKMQAREKIMFF